MDTLSKIIAATRATCPDQNLAPDAVFESVASSVQIHMAAFDASHDFAHVLRVVSLAQSIMAAEYYSSSGEDDDNNNNSSSKPSPRPDPTIVLLAALLHDVTDSKYTTSASAAASTLTDMLTAATTTTTTEINTEAITAIVSAVSYSTEKRDPAHVRSVLATHPELAIVQDADRLDALGAVGVARAFTFGGARTPHAPMQRSREHMTDKLDKLESMMKTNTGKKLARQRSLRIHTFCQWWDQECAILDGTGAK